MALPPWVLPTVQALVSLCCAFVGLVYADRLVIMALRGLVKLLARSPYKMYKFESLKIEEKDSSKFPKVLVQMPMRNEKEVYQRSIGAVCGFQWPRDRLTVQVLDDSDDALRSIKDLVQAECESWKRRGVNVKYENRPTREGYKAGNLAYGLEQSYAKECEFVVVFDADFEPAPDFLLRSVPFLVHNPELGFVMCNWEHRNGNDSVLSRLQDIFFANYFALANVVGSGFFNFVLFFGSGGVWRMQALVGSGGWRSRVLIEDFDLALRGVLNGWKSLYLRDIRSKAEVAVGYKTFRIQSSRLSNGAMNLLKLRFLEISKSKAFGVGTKYYILVSIFNFSLYEHFAGFSYSCIIVPAVLLLPEIQVSKIILLAPFFVHILNILTLTPRHFHVSLAWVLFENVRGVFRASVALSALTGGTVEWIVTKRVAAEKSSKAKLTWARSGDVFPMELIIGFYLFLCASLATSSGYWPLQVYLFLQSLAYFLCGLNVQV